MSRCLEFSCDAFIILFCLFTSLLFGNSCWQTLAKTVQLWYFYQLLLALANHFD